MRRVLYFGCLDGGHYLYEVGGRRGSLDVPPGVPWSLGLMDTGLLKNGRHPDTCDGRVFWTCAKGQWLALIWWDRSGDERPGSNSGFYVQGFEVSERQSALEFACSQFPAITQRQRHPLVLQP